MRFASSVMKVRIITVRDSLFSIRDCTTQTNGSIQKMDDRRRGAMRCHHIEHNQTAVHRTYHKRNPHAIPHHITINSIIVKELINQSHIKAKMRISTAEQMNPTRRNTMEDCHIYHQPNTPGLWEHPSTFIGVACTMVTAGVTTLSSCRMPSTFISKRPRQPSDHRN